MFEDSVSTADLASMVGALARLDARVDDAERIGRIRLLEEIKSAAAAAQAKETAAFVASQKSPRSVPALGRRMSARG